MSRINHFLYERTEGEKYATVFYCVLDSAGTLIWSNAGHVTPFLVRRSGDLLTLDTTGMPLGMLDCGTFGVETAQLQAGDKIVAFSDGLTEAQDLKGTFFDAGQLKDLLRARVSDGAADLHSALVRQIQEFTSNAIQNDDITVLVLEYGT
jgi:serine phosphatase RsbU (regulator of sigma subunit)